MNESEKRRKQLLEQTRRRYGDSRIPPAIHPRYSSLYSSLYRSSEENADEAGGFGFRMFIAVLLFAAFVAMDYSDEKIASVDSKRIVKEIETGVDVEEVWKKL